MIDRYREKLAVDMTTNADKIKLVDTISFWTFMTGLYHYKYVVGIFIALIFERQCINWLKNRFGCTYFRLQKFIELDIRRESLRYNWLNPKYQSYDIENYRMHYFANDFDQIKRRIVENISENPDKIKDEYGRKPLGDFVPHKIAERLKETIQFSVKLDLRCTDIDFDIDTRLKLNEAHEDGVDFFRKR